MNIKKILLAMPVLMTLVACSNIAEDERLIFVESKEIIVQSTGRIPATVLVEDFTGQKCTWCPQGTRVLEEQIALYGEDHVIPVAIHSGPQGYRGTATNVGLMTDLGAYYWNKMGFNSSTSQPTAVFNRRTISDERDAWSQCIYNELRRVALANIGMSVVYDENKREATMTINCTSKESAEVNLQVWITENNITALQIDGGETKRDYIHNHVLRDAVNGVDGEPITIGTEMVQKTYTYVLPSNYVAENCQIVAFLYDKDGVWQATKSNVNK